MTTAKPAGRESAGLTLVGIVVAVAIHAALLWFVSWLPEPDPPPPCPTQREMCEAHCGDARELDLAAYCPRRSACACDDKPIDVVELVDLAPVVPEIPEPVVPVVPVVPAPLAEPEPEPEPAPEPERGPGSTSTKAAAVRAKQKAVQKAVAEIEVARVLGTYGSHANDGTVFDVIGSTESSLDDLFAQGISTTAQQGAGDGTGLKEATGGGGKVSVAGASIVDVGNAGAAPKRTGTVSVSSATVSAADNVVRRRVGSLRGCYMSALADGPELSGSLSYTLSVGPAGAVENVAVGEDTVGSAALQACVTKRVRRWRFPAGDKIEVPFTVAFAGR